MRSFRNRSKVCPEITSTRYPSTSVATLYLHLVPGWNTRGSSPSLVTMSFNVPLKRLGSDFRYISSTGVSWKKPLLSPAVWVSKCRIVMGLSTGDNVGPVPPMPA